MQYTNKVSVLRNLLLKHVPEDEPESTDANLYLYIQDCSACLDYYVMAQSSEFMDMFALVDALQNPYVLDLEYVPLSELEGHKLYYRIYRSDSRPQYDMIYAQLHDYKYC